MLPQATPDGATLTLRSTGAMRLVQAAFLGVWLAFWAVGEAIALTIAAMVIRSFFVSGTRISDWMSGGGTPAFVMLFLVVWVIFWTIGGVAAGTSFLRSVSGEDRLSAVPEGVAVLWRAGPFRRRTMYERRAVRRIRLRGSDRALVVDGAAGTTVLTDLGTRDERETALAWLRNHLDVSAELAPLDPATPPPGWDISHDPTGGTRMMKPGRRVRRRQALVLWCVTALTSLGWVSALMNGPPGVGNLLALALSMLLAAGSAWLTWGRTEWIVRVGSLVFRRQLGDRVREDRFELARLEVEHSTDSDGDHQYHLIVQEGNRRRTICSAHHDDVDVVDCARWLKAATGFPLKLPR